MERWNCCVGPRNKLCMANWLPAKQVSCGAARLGWVAPRMSPARRRAAALPQLYYATHPNLTGWLAAGFNNNLRTHTPTNKITSMRCLAQRHQGGGVAISDAEDSRGSKCRVGVIQSKSPLPSTPLSHHCHRICKHLMLCLTFGATLHYHS